MDAIKDFGVGYEDHFPRSRKVDKPGARAGVRLPFR